MISYVVNIAISDCADERIYCQLFGIQAAIIAIIDYILNIILFTLFIHKLRQLIFARLQHDSFDSDINIILQNAANNRLLDVITKQTIIGVFLTLFNQAFGTSVFLTGTWNLPTQTDLVCDYLTRAIEGAFVCFLL